MMLKSATCGKITSFLQKITKESVFLPVLFLIGLLFLPGYGAHLDQYSEQEIMYYNVYSYCETFNVFPEFADYLEARDIINIQDSIERDHGMSVFYPVAFIWKIRDKSPYAANLIWHTYIYFICFAGVVSLHFLVKEMYSPKVAVLTTLVCFFTPRIFAEMHYNNKDAILLSLALITFALGWNLKKKCSFKNAISFGLIGAVISNMRIIGLFIWGIVGLWVLISIIADKEFDLKVLLKMLVCFASMALLFALITPAVWPGVGAYIKYQIESSQNFRWGSSLLFNGKIYSKELTGFSRKYLPVILVMTLPVSILAMALLGAVEYIIKIFRKKKDSFTKNSFIFATAFAGMFPFAYAVLKNATVYNGWRHFYFTYASIIILVAGGISFLVESVNKKHIGELLVSAAVVVYFAGICINAPYQYAYYNIPCRFMVKDNFELDYWDMSFKQALTFISEYREGEIKVACIDSPSIWGVNAQVNNALSGDVASRVKLVSDWQNADYGVDEAEYVIINPTYSVIYNSDIYEEVKDKFNLIYEIKSYGNVICEVYCR